jgi:cell division protein FtsI/penicillin-binding protein 2
MNQRSRLSLIFLQIFIASLLFALMGRLFYLQVAAGPTYKNAALSIQSRDVVTPATRGLIVDSSGVPLALNKVGLAVTVDRTKIDKQADKGVAVIKNLAILLNLKYADGSAGNFLRERRLVAGLALASNRFRLQKRQIHRLHFKLLSDPISTLESQQHRLLFVITQG